MQTILRLHREHTALIDGFKQIRRLGIAIPEGRETFSRTKKQFEEHLRFEEEAFYPVLFKAAETDQALKNTLQIFNQEMSEIAEALTFFFAMDPSTPQEFSRAYEKNYSLLRQRILREEHVLFTRYEKTVRQKVGRSAG